MSRYKTHLRISGTETVVCVHYFHVKYRAGCTDGRHGPKLEPDEPEHIEIDWIENADGTPIDFDGKMKIALESEIGEWLDGYYESTGAARKGFAMRGKNQFGTLYHKEERKHGHLVEENCTRWEVKTYIARQVVATAPTEQEAETLARTLNGEKQDGQWKRDRNGCYHAQPGWSGSPRASSGR